MLQVRRQSAVMGQLGMEAGACGESLLEGVCRNRSGQGFPSDPVAPPWRGSTGTQGSREFGGGQHQEWGSSQPTGDTGY